MAQDVFGKLIATLVFAFAVALCTAQPAAAQVTMPSPAWSALSPQDRATLAPLAPPEWDRLDGQRKQKWLGLAKRYPTMSPERQARMRDQMQAWSRLTPDQRRTARERYEAMKKLPPEQKAEMRRKWEEYRKLPPEEQAAMRARSAATAKKPLPIPRSPSTSVAPLPGAPPAPPASPRAAPGMPGATAPMPAPSAPPAR
ncbi:MAG: DUF3106 domain-containing protein [Betaproteobacteria bacterium]